MDAQTYYITAAAVILGTLIIIPIGLAYLWNTKYRPAQQAKGHQTEPFGTILKNLLAFTLKEDKTPIIPTKKPNPIIQKITYKKLYLTLILLTLTLIAIREPLLALIPAITLPLIAITRAQPTFKKRKQITNRLFEVATSEFKYSRGAEQQPNKYVNIKKWENLTTPTEIIVTYPTSFRADIPTSRDSFERHFNHAITEDNTWLYEWKQTENHVICKPVGHLPDQAPYPGSENQEWHKFILGEGTSGPVGYSVLLEPHTLLAGPTGSGKSVLQRNLVFHCIQHNDMWQFVGIDLKRVELSVYAKYKETVKAIAVDLETATDVIRQCRDTMMERYTIMESKGLNHFMDLKDENGKTPKAIMIMVDEAFMLLAPENIKSDEGKQRDEWHGECGTLIGEILRLGRAAGIYVIMAFQRPDAAVLGGERRLNLANRIAAGRLDSTASGMVFDSGIGTLLPGIRGRGGLKVLGNFEQFQGYFAKPSWIDEWLQSHPEREPSLFGLEDVEVQRQLEESELDFQPDDELQFDLDEDARQLLEDERRGDVRPDFVAYDENNEVPEEFYETFAEKSSEELPRPLTTTKPIQPLEDQKISTTVEPTANISPRVPKRPNVERSVDSLPSRPKQPDAQEQVQPPASLKRLPFPK